MTILQSCCCWRSVRKGSFACGIYAALYYAINAGVASYTLHEELTYLRNTSLPPESIVDHRSTTEISVLLTALLLTFSSSGILTSCVLLYGLHKDCKVLLIPWVLNIIIFLMLDACHAVFMLMYALGWNPAAAVFITVDLFLNALNTYALLCVISQYQELKAGRGRALAYENNRYSARPTSTSYLSTRKAITYHETRPTPTQSPSGPAPSMIIDDPSPNLNNKGPRKSVKFPDNSSPTHNGAQLLDPWTIDVKSSPMLHHGKAADTAPLIDSAVGGVHHPPMQSIV